MLIVVSNLSFISQSMGGTTIYCGRSLVVKIIIIVPFDMQSAYFRNFRSTHVILSVKPKIVTLADAMYRLASLPLVLSDEYGMINELNNS